MNTFKFMHSFNFSDEEKYDGLNSIDYQDYLFNRFKLGDIQGKTVLDIGCSKGTKC